MRLLAIFLFFCFGTVCQAQVSVMQWRWDGFDMKTHKRRDVADVREFGGNPIVPACFGSAFSVPTPKRKNKKMMYDCTPEKPNNNFVAIDGALRTYYNVSQWGTASGAQFYRNFPFHQLGDSAVLEYDFRFSPRFSATKGGKLPGLYGGHRACSGGNDASSKRCFSLRLMWRRKFGAATYMYIPISLQTEEFCKHCYVPATPNPTCAQVKMASDSGVLDKQQALGRTLPSAPMKEVERAFCDFGRRFQLGAYPHNESYAFFFPNSTTRDYQYLKVTQYVRLNDIDPETQLPIPNGVYALKIDGQLVHHTPHIVYRANKQLDISGLFYSTFMGGSDATWAPKKTQFTEFKSFAISSLNHKAVRSVKPNNVTFVTGQQYKFTVYPLLGKDVTNVAFSTERTCMNETGLVDAHISTDRKHVTVTFPYKGLFIMCARGWASHSVMYASQDGAQVLVK